MRILQLGKFHPIRGGVEKVMLDITQGLSEKGIPCDMLCANFEKSQGITEITLNEHGKLFIVPTLFKAAGTMIAPRMISWLRKHAREYEIIHIHHPDPMAAIALMLSGFKGRVLLHWHSDIISQKFFLFFYKPIQKWLIKRAERIIGTTPVYVADSPALRKAQDKTTFVPIGIQPLISDVVEANKIKSPYICKIIVFSLGRLVEYKGFEYLIDAAGYLPEDYHVVIGGTGPLKDALQKRIDNLGLKERVTLLGFVDNKDVPCWFSAADVFVLSSVMKTEAFGIVQIEAMSVGTPVVATRIPGSGVSWVNKDGVSGLNVEPRDPEALAKAILAVTKDETAHKSFGAGAKSRFEEMFRKELMFNKLEDIYEKRV